MAQLVCLFAPVPDWSIDRGIARRREGDRTRMRCSSRTFEGQVRAIVRARKWKKRRKRKSSLSVQTFEPHSSTLTMLLKILPFYIFFYFIKRIEKLLRVDSFPLHVARTVKWERLGVPHVVVRFQPLIDGAVRFGEK